MLHTERAVLHIASRGAATQTVICMRTASGGAFMWQGADMCMWGGGARAYVCVYTQAQRAAEVERWMYQVLYCTSGALWNLSRHPDNHTQMYCLELEVRNGIHTIHTIRTHARNMCLCAVCVRLCVPIKRTES